MKLVMRCEALSNQLPMPSEQALLSILSVVGIHRVIPIPGSRQSSRAVVVVVVIDQGEVGAGRLGVNVHCD